tara:strand:+ start:927 stop:1439 length:513 start_codon:yes stop_codon:yes gene_type:complete
MKPVIRKVGDYSPCKKFRFKCRENNRTKKTGQPLTCNELNCCIADYKNDYWIKVDDYEQKKNARLQYHRGKLYETRDKLNVYKVSKGCQSHKIGFGKCSNELRNHPDFAFTLDFHHLNTKTKSSNVSELVKTMNWNKIKLEINKCVVLCSNHHRLLGRHDHVLTSQKRRT